MWRGRYTPVYLRLCAFRGGLAVYAGLVSTPTDTESPSPPVDTPGGSSSGGENLEPPAGPPANGALALRHCDVPDDLTSMLVLAERLAEAGAVLPGHLRRQPGNLLAIMFAARALDVPLWTAIQSMHLVDGKIGYEATFQRALVRRAGHRIRVIERTGQRAVVGITRADDDTELTAEYTWAEAQQAKLTEKDNWRKYPRAMLVARATVIAVREITPEVLFGAAHTPDELGLVTDEAGTPVTVVPSVRVDHETAPARPARVRDPDEAAAMREQYRTAVETAENADQLNEVWTQARDEGVLAAPLYDDGTTVQQALHLRAGALAAARAAAEPEPVDAEPVDAEPVPGTALALREP